MKILFLAPHTSTGGMPQFLLKRLEVLKKYTKHELYVVEYQCYSIDYVVQRNKIKSLLLENFYTLYEDKMVLQEIIKSVQPDIIHIDEMSERLDREMVKALYSNKRTYRIVETCHDVSFNPADKIFKPDLYLFCTPYHAETFKVNNYEVITYPIVKKFPCDKESARKKLGFEGVNVINVGLWTPGKNQGEGIEMARKYPEMTFHFIGNQAGNFQDYWKPLMENLPSNVKVWGERDDIETFMEAADIFLFNSTWECNPLVLREAISYGLPIVARNLPQYGKMYNSYLYDINTDLRTIKSRNYVVESHLSYETFSTLHHYQYLKIKSCPIVQQEVTITQYFVVNPYLEINCPVDEEFLVQFFDENGSIFYENTINSNSWVKLNRQWFTKWRTVVTVLGTKIYDSVLNYEGKRVAIIIDSDSLGDNIAWMPYCLEFQQKHKCQVIVVTNRCNLFKDAYPELEFLHRGEQINNIHGQYIVGWHYDADKEPELCNTIPLQKAATNILGLPYKEIKPRIKYDIGKNQYGRYVTIATNSTAGLKFWVREYWQQLIDYLVESGYKVINTSRERNAFNNCYQLEDTTLENTMSVIHHSKFFVGLSSGLSWVAWALNKEVFMISNFTESNHEFSCNRIVNTSVCHGCWNNKNFKFDKGDYNWCPIWKGYSKQFECQKSITPQMVIDEIKKASIN